MELQKSGRGVGKALIVSILVMGALLGWRFLRSSGSSARGYGPHADLSPATAPPGAISQEQAPSAAVRQAIPRHEFLGAVEVVEAVHGGQAYPCQVVLASASGDQRAIDAAAGTWTGLLPTDEFRVVGVRGTGMVPAFESSAALSQLVPRIEVVVSKPASWRLSVVDGAKGDDLGGFDLWAVDERVEDPDGLFRKNASRIPEDGVHRLIHDGASPCAVPEVGSTGLYWVSAPGYTPRTFQRNAFQREAKVELFSAGLLSVDLTQAVVDFANRMRSAALDVDVALTDPRDGRVLWSATVAGQETWEPRSVRVGNYVVTASLRGSDFLAMPLFTREVNIAAGQHARVTVDIDDPHGAIEASPLVVIVVLPPIDPEICGLEMLSWSEEDGRWSPCFAREGLHDWTSLDEGKARSLFLRSVPPGRLRFRVTPSGHEIEYEHHEHQPGRENEVVVIDCSDTAEVDVVAIDTVREDKRLAVEWSYAGKDQTPCGRVAIAPGAGEARVFCPSRPIRLRLVGATFTSEEVTVEPRAGERTNITLGKARKDFAYLRVAAWANGSHEFLESSYWRHLTVQAIGHDGRLVQIEFGTQGTNASLVGSKLVVPDFAQAVLVLSAPGKYRLGGPEDSVRVEVDVPPGLSDYAFIRR